MYTRAASMQRRARCVWGARGPRRFFGRWQNRSTRDVMRRDSAGCVTAVVYAHAVAAVRDSGR
eukprot:4222702-Pyramimonas_sp.AAC.2